MEDKHFSFRCVAYCKRLFANELWANERKGVFIRKVGKENGNPTNGRIIIALM